MTFRGNFATNHNSVEVKPVDGFLIYVIDIVSMKHGFIFVKYVILITNAFYMYTDFFFHFIVTFFNNNVMTTHGLIKSQLL